MAVNKSLVTVLAWHLLIFGTSCSRSSARLRPPHIDAAAAARAALAEYDANHDGVLSGTELDRIPAIRASLDKFDTDGDGSVSAEEIAARIASWQDFPVAAMPLNCSVRLDRRPLAGAAVVLEPERFLGDQLRPATGVTDASGFAILTIGAEDGAPALSGVQCGLYKVRITKMQGGKQVLPGKYNASTKLGLEVAPDASFARTGLRFEL